MEEEVESKERNKRVVELLTRKDTLDEEIIVHRTKADELTTEREGVEDEIAELLGLHRTNGAAPASSRTCRLCGQSGHIIARTKTSDGRDTCPTYPNGKLKEE
jgi:hypothetical protein